VKMVELVNYVEMVFDFKFDVCFGSLFVYINL